MGGGLSPPLSLVKEWDSNREKFPYGERRPPYLIGILGTLVALTLVVVGARLWARCKIRRNAGIDDLLIVLSLPFLFGSDTCQFMAFYYYGLDRHTWEITPWQAEHIRIVTLAMSNDYIVISTLVKVSILLFYRRLGEGAMTTTWLWVIRGSLAFVGANGLVFFILTFVSCQPFEAFYKRVNPDWVTTHGYTCIDEGASFIASAVISVILDGAVCILPLLVVSRLQMPRKQKWALTGIFGVGFFLCVCGVMRAVCMYKVYYSTYDETWYSVPAWIWTLMETHFSIICASAPSLKMYFGRVFKSTSSDTYVTQSSRHGYDHFSSGRSRRQATDGTKDDEDISMEEMLAGGDAEATVGTGHGDDPFPDGGSEIEPSPYITVTRGVDVTYTRDGKTLSTVSHGQEDAMSKRSIGPKASNESLLDKTSPKTQSSF